MGSKTVQPRTGRSPAVRAELAQSKSPATTRQVVTPAVVHDPDRQGASEETHTEFIIDARIPLVGKFLVNFRRLLRR